MTVRMRQEVERKIVRALLERLITKEGFLGTVNDGEEEVITESKDIEAIMAVMFSTDEDQLIIKRPKERSDFGWVTFIYGNEGPDVIHDYTTNLEPFMTEAKKVAEYYDADGPWVPFE